MADNNFVSLVKILAAPIQEAENAVWQVLQSRSVDVATGDALTLLGKIVGQARQGVSDDDLYRIYVRARVLANRSNGNGEDIYRIFSLLVDDPNAALQIWNTGVASFELAVDGVVTSPDVALIYVGFLQTIVSAGVRAVLQVQPTTPDGIVTWGDGNDVYTPGAGQAGWGDDNPTTHITTSTMADWRST